MAGRKEEHHTGEVQVPREFREDKQTEQTEELRDENQRDTERHYYLKEVRYGRELREKIRSNFSHCVKPENVLLCIHIHDSKVLVERDIQQIRCVITNKGDIEGANCLLEHIVRYKGWLLCLLNVLRDPKVSQAHVADEIEQALELLQEERKKQASVVQGLTDETCMINMEIEGADRDTDLPQTKRPFGSLETTGRPEPMPMMRTISVTKLTVEEIFTDITSDTNPRRISPTANSLRTFINPKAMDLTDHTQQTLVSPASVTSKEREKEILSREDTLDLPHEYAKADVNEGHSGSSGHSVTSTQTWRPEEPVSDDTASTSREIQEKATVSEYRPMCDMRRSEEGQNEKPESRRTSTAEDKRPIDVLLVGKTGNGKSSAGNSILLKEAFETNDDMTSCTKAAQFDYSEFDGVIFKVVDGPGLGDTDLDKKDALKLVLNAMSDAIAMNAEGYHAILVVVRYGGKFTQEDVTTLETMKDIFGESFIKDHAILVMTHGDVFNKKAKKGKYTFEQWCKRQEGVFKRLLSEVENRIVLFDNEAEDNRTRYEQVQKLVEVIDGLSSKGKRYNEWMFEKAKESRNQAMERSKTPILYENALREAALITKRFYDINFDNVKEAYESLQSLLKRAQKLTERIKEQDKNTGVPRVSITFAEELKRFIEAEIETIGKIVDHRQERDDIKRDLHEEGSNKEKEKKEERKESKWKSEAQSQKIDDVQKGQEEQEDHKHEKQMEIEENEHEQNADRKALMRKRTEKDNQLSSKWKEGKRERAAKLMEKKETRKQMKQSEREEKPQIEIEEDGRQHKLNKTLETFEQRGQMDNGETNEEEIDNRRVLDEKKKGKMIDFEEQNQTLKLDSKDQEYEKIDDGTQVKPQEENITETGKQMTQSEREENQKNEIEGDGRQNKLNKTLKTFEQTGQRDSGNLIEQKNFDETKEEEVESRRVLDEKTEGQIEDFEEQNQPSKLDSQDQEYEKIDADTEVKPQEEKITELKELNDKEHLQEQEREESVRQMAQLDVIEPEQHIQKGEESYRTSAIHKREHDGMEVRQKEDNVERTELLEILPKRHDTQQRVEKYRQKDETIPQEEDTVQHQVKSQNELQQKETRQGTGGHEPHREILTENLELRRRSLETVDLENLKEQLQGGHIGKAGLLEDLHKRHDTQRKVEKYKQEDAAMKQGEHATQQAVKSQNELLQKEEQWRAGEYERNRKILTENLELRRRALDTLRIENLKEQLQIEHLENPGRPESLHKMHKTQRKMVKIKPRDNVMEHGEYMTQQEAKSQNKRLNKDKQRKTVEYAQHREMFTENWEFRRKPLDTVGLEQLEQLRGEHIRRAKQLEKDYKSIKGETTSVLARIGKSVRKMLSKTFQWFEDKFSRGERVDLNSWNLLPL